MRTQELVVVGASEYSTNLAAKTILVPKVTYTLTREDKGPRVVVQGNHPTKSQLIQAQFNWATIHSGPRHAQLCQPPRIRLVLSASSYIPKR